MGRLLGEVRYFMQKVRQASRVGDHGVVAGGEFPLGPAELRARPAPNGLQRGGKEGPCR